MRSADSPLIIGYNAIEHSNSRASFEMDRPILPSHVKLIIIQIIHRSFSEGRRGCSETEMKPLQDKVSL